MSPGRRNEDGVPRTQQRLDVPPGRVASEERWRGADAAKVEKLLRTKLQRRAHARGLELRHSAYGYALIDTARKRVDDRSDLTLREVESWLERG